MKIKYVLIGLFIIVSSCDELEDAIDKEVDITTSYTNSVTLDVLSENDPAMEIPFQASNGFDLFNNADVAEVIGTPEQIKKIQIVSIQYEYRNFSGNVDAKTKNSYFFLGTAFMDGQSFPVADQNIAEADVFGTRFNVSGDFSRVNDFITEGKIFTYLYNGSVTHNPVNVVVEITLTLKLTVEVNLDDL